MRVTLLRIAVHSIISQVRDTGEKSGKPGKEYLYRPHRYLASCDPDRSKPGRNQKTPDLSFPPAQAKQYPVKHSTSAVKLYTRDGCHLCEDAHQLLRRYGLVPQLVDIDAVPQLRERYDCCVPVVEIDGKVRFRGRVNEVLLRRLLRKRPANPSSADPQ
jgi:glutaredoxin